MSEIQSLQQLNAWVVLMDQDTQINEPGTVGISCLSRAQIVELQNAMAPIQCELPDPLHRFAPGMYMRELLVPAGMLIVGKIHRHDHFLMVLSGVAIIKSEFGDDVVHPGYIAVSKAGVKRIVLAITDTRFITIHANPGDCEDMEIVEANHIEPEMALSGGNKEVLQ